MTGRLAVLTILVLAHAGVAQAVHPHAESLKKQATAWLAANNAFGPTHDIVKDLGEALHETLDEGRNFTLALGPNLTKSGKAALVASWGDKLFAFDLTAAQQMQMGLKAGGAEVSGGTKLSDKPRLPYPVKITGVQLDGGSSLDGDKAFRGQILCESKPDLPKNAAIRCAYSAKGNTRMKFVYLDALPENGIAKFDYKSFNDGEDEKIAGPIVVFVDVVLIEETPGGITFHVLSNATGILVDVK